MCQREREGEREKHKFKNQVGTRGKMIKNESGENQALSFFGRIGYVRFVEFSSVTQEGNLNYT